MPELSTAWTPGRLVVVEGIDGSGKSSLIAEICRELPGPVLTTRQPTDAYRSSPLFRQYVTAMRRDRSVAAAESLVVLSAQDRLSHVTETVLPALAAGTTVICDRYLLSAFAYFAARGIGDMTWVADLNRFVPAPDLLVYLDIDPALALDRVVARDGRSVKIEEQDLAVMHEVRAAYLRYVPVVPAARRLVLDATEPLADLARAVLAELSVAGEAVPR